MATAHSVTIVLRGKSYVISTTENEHHVVEAAQLLDTTVSKMSQAGSVHREDQLILFSALQALVSILKERDGHAESIAAHADALEAALLEE